MLVESIGTRGSWILTIYYINMVKLDEKSVSLMFHLLIILGS